MKLTKVLTEVCEDAKERCTNTVEHRGRGRSCKSVLHCSISSLSKSVSQHLLPFLTRTAESAGAGVWPFLKQAALIGVWSVYVSVVVLLKQIGQREQ